MREEGFEKPSSQRSERLGATLSRRGVLAGLVVGALAQCVGRAAANGPFSVGILTPVTPAAHEKNAARELIERAVSRPVEMLYFPQAERLVELVAEGKLPLALHTSLTFAAANALCGCSVPLLRPVVRRDEAGSRGVVIVRRSGAIRSVDDLAWARILGNDPSAVAASVARLGLINRLAGAGTPSFVEGGGVKATAAFTAGQGDALVGFERIDGDGNPIGGTMDGLSADYAVVWRSMPIWHGPLAVAASLPEPLRRRLVDAVLAAPPGGPAMAGLGLRRVTGFRAASLDDYATLTALLRAK